MSSTTPVPYTYRVNIFNWSYVPSYSIDDNLTGHILHGSPQLLEVLNNFGQVFLRACAFPAASDQVLTPESYNSLVLQLITSTFLVHQDATPLLWEVFMIISYITRLHFRILSETTFLVHI